MAVRPTDSIDKKLAQMYASKVTVNLEAKSTLSPNEFWNSMELIALNNKAVMNFRCRKKFRHLPILKGRRHFFMYFKNPKRQFFGKFILYYN